MTSGNDTDRNRYPRAVGLAVAGALVGTLLLAIVGAPGALAQADENVSEPAAEIPVPEPGDPYFEAEDPDGEWISYRNPRDEYRNPYLGDGSGKLCVTLLNEAGEPITGRTIPETRVTMPTGETIEWHTRADPFVVEYPLTEHYDRPFDSDQFGAADDLPQGDGYLDSHCIEFHGPTETATISYGNVTIAGEHADRVELVGFVQQANEAWETDVDPIEAAVPYEEVGSFTYEPGGSHGQAVAVLQLQPPRDDDGDEANDGPGGGTESDGDESTDGSDGDGRTADDPATSDPDGVDETDGNGTGDDENGSTVVRNEGAERDEDASDELSGFGPLAAVLALSIGGFFLHRRR
ncbi:PGF-CTERM sorting domain-containing protein [Halovivax limisalsi]|uniref:PGF-CTERM sorting domain-containing protein n=1 Tax=Halovivax limisalsi TaxID=1453760 RepID=UPI001FFDD6E5|nr:PGF-CTERM sorting domain-containing protein [Halovivax limisalsi]